MRSIFSTVPTLLAFFLPKKFNFATHAVDTFNFNGNITYMICIVRIFCFIMGAISCLSLFGFTAMAEEQSFFESKIRPVLQANRPHPRSNS